MQSLQGHSRRESRMFWMALYGFTGAWILFSIAALISLSFTWLVLDLVALALNAANVIGYTKCERSSRQRVASVASGFLTSTVLGAASRWFSSSGATAAAAPAAAAPARPASDMV